MTEQSLDEQRAGARSLAVQRRTHELERMDSLHRLRLHFRQSERLDAQAAEKAAYLVDMLRERLAGQAPNAVRDLRGLGLMVGVELRHRAQPVLAGLLRRGVIALPAGSTVLRMLPPLVVTENELDQVASAMSTSLRSQGVGVA